MLVLKVAIGTFRKKETCITTLINYAVLLFSLFTNLTGFITMPLGSYTIHTTIAFASYHLLVIALFLYFRDRQEKKRYAHFMPLRITSAEKKASLTSFIKQRKPTQFEIHHLFKKIREDKQKEKEAHLTISNPLHQYFSQKSKEQFRLKKLSQNNML